MTDLSPGLLARLVLRYVAGYLLLKGIVPQEMADMIANDPELAAITGGAMMLIIEGFYVMARKFGWAK